MFSKPCLHDTINNSIARVRSFRIHLRVILISIHLTSMLTVFKSVHINLLARSNKTGTNTEKERKKRETKFYSRGGSGSNVKNWD